MTLFIVPVVEGQTEQGCVERLLHRVWGELLGRELEAQQSQPPAAPGPTEEAAPPATEGEASS